MVTANEPIVRAGFSGEGFFAIAGGRARVQRSDGHEVILGHGDFFGDLSLIDGADRNATVVAETMSCVSALSACSLLARSSARR